MKRASIASRSALAAAALVASLCVRADGGEHRRAPALPAYAQECGACHAPFPPRMLAAASWQRIMQGLSRHFGTDASLDPATGDAIGAWLASHAGSGKRVESNPPEDRITRSSAFVRKHHEVPAAAWSRAAIGRPSNCGACHPRADQGEFHEHDVRIPR
jgi:hypothetical protein